MTTPKKECPCCGKQFPVHPNNRSHCWSCEKKIAAGLTLAEICEQLANQTKSSIEASRLMDLSERHRLFERSMAEHDQRASRILREIDELRASLKTKKKKVYCTISGKQVEKQTWRCGRCGTVLSVKRCLACELKINEGG